MTDERRFTLDDLAEEVWMEAAGSVDAAVVAMRRRLRADVALYRALIDPLITSALRRAVERVARNDGGIPVATAGTTPRFFAKSGLREREPGRPSAPSSAVVQGLRQLATQNLLTFVLTSGKRLGDATRAEVLADADEREWRVAKDCRWLRLIAARLSRPGAIVRDELKHEDLVAIQEQAAIGLSGDQWVLEARSEHVAGSTSDDERDPATSAPLASVVALVPTRGARG